MRISLSGLVCSVSLALAAPAVAHHSAAAFDTRQEVTVTGTVTAYAFRNPHVYLVVQIQRLFSLDLHHQGICTTRPIARSGCPHGRPRM